MSAEQLFSRWVKATLFTFVAVFAYYLAADLYMPLTTDSLVQRFVVQVAPQVPGRVVAVAVHNNQQVKRGDLLFELDPADYQLKVELASLQLEQSQQKHQQLTAALQSGNAQVEQAQLALQEAQREALRLQRLFAEKLIPRQQLEQSETLVLQAIARVKASLADLATLEAELGIPTEELVQIKQARNQLAQARLALSRSKVYADVDGIVSDLQLEVGTNLTANQPTLALVSNQQSWISALFREKSLLHVAPGSIALITFDALPGQVFSAAVRDIDAGVANGQSTPDGRLATADSSSRWVRDAQRLKVNLALDDQLPQQLVVGSRATVQLIPAEQSWLQWLAAGQIRLISLLHYVY
ncbi:HlyD family secretion protein [Rheinheimera texasensis]|uniref:HlyD family secretion protein n=1 Tax=Rheinheimera texasensis TaxID=306205 RepID=UPI0032B1AF19